MTDRRIVVSGQGALERVADELRRSGHDVVPGWRLPSAPWDLRDSRRFSIGVVDDEGSARAALIAAARGTGIVVDLDESSELGQLFVEDLSRLGVVERRAPSPLSPEQQRLLALLRDGRTVPEAATALFISVRTAERRLQECRQAFAVRSTAEAVRKFATGAPA